MAIAYAAVTNTTANEMMVMVTVTARRTRPKVTTDNQGAPRLMRDATRVKISKFATLMRVIREL
jgi:DNA-binding transcriptional regulator YiaG